MPPENNAPPAGAPPAGQVPAGTTPTTAPPTTPPPGGQAPPTSRTPEEYEREIQSLRQEAAKYRTERNELDTRVKTFETAQLSETEKQQKRIAELERQQAEAQTRLQERTIRASVMMEAQKRGIVDPEAAYRLLDLAALQTNDDGEPTNLEAVLGDMLKTRPYLLSNGASAGSPGNPAANRGTLTRADIEKMTPDEINRRWPEVQAAMNQK